MATDKSLETTKSVEQKPIDEIGSLDDSFDDLMMAAEHLGSQTQRFALCVDATSSMGHVWERAKQALKTAVDHIQSHATCPISIRVVAYRDHECDGRSVLDASKWSSNTNYLKKFIADMSCFGGGDYPESIGHGLGFLLEDQNIPSQVILIGDAPGKAGSFGYAEAQTFGAAGRPIYALYTNDEPRLVAAFKKIAKLSGGKAFLLESDTNLDDIFKVLLASNKALQITYQATSIEGKRLSEELKG